jgi:hypothetical protein
MKRAFRIAGGDTVSLSRRTFLWLTPFTVIAPKPALGQSTPSLPAAAALPPSFPSGDPELAREMVQVSHGNAARVRELLASWPALANAAWDWGYGDWESALGAASHVGNREIAAALLAAGARPSIFSAAMLGQLDVVKAFVAASPGVQKTRGPHGLSLLSHARAGGAGAAEVLKYLESLGDADPRYTNAPIADEDRKALVGTYAFGTAANEQFVVTASERGLSIERTGRGGRNLFHQGGRVFHPPGADRVRIRFDGGSPAASVTVEDGTRVVTAKRVA